MLVLLVICPRWLWKLLESVCLCVHPSIRLSICASIQCQHFQNPKALRPLSQRRWNLACVFNWSWDKTSRKWNFEFRPSAAWDQPIDSPVRVLIHHLLWLSVYEETCASHLFCNIKCITLSLAVITEYRCCNSPTFLVEIKYTVSRKKRSAIFVHNFNKFKHIAVILGVQHHENAAKTINSILFVALSDKKIVKVACGRSHTLLATGTLLLNYFLVRGLDQYHHQYHQ